jgi:hypothetical protein
MSKSRLQHRLRHFPTLGNNILEQVFRFNERKGSDSDRFATALRGIIGRKLTYKELIGNGAIASAA